MLSKWVNEFVFTLVILFDYCWLFCYFFILSHLSLFLFKKVVPAILFPVSFVELPEKLMQIFSLHFILFLSLNIIMLFFFYSWYCHFYLAFFARLLFFFIGSFCLSLSIFQLLLFHQHIFLVTVWWIFGEDLFLLLFLFLYFACQCQPLI